MLLYKNKQKKKIFLLLYIAAKNVLNADQNLLLNLYLA